MHATITLWADVRGGPNGYGRLMRLPHVLGRDVRAHVWDYVVAGAMVAVAIVALTTRIDVEDTDIHRFHANTWWSWALTIAICAVLFGRRRWPLRTLAVALVLMLPLELARHRDSVAFFALVIALFSIAAHRPSRSAWWGPAMIAALYAALALDGTTILVAAPVIGPILFSTAFAVGRVLRRGRSRQERDAETAIERAAAAVETAELRAADERLRMAQELHDVVAHSLSVIAVQAGIGVHLIDRQPADAALALDAIRVTTDSAAGELTRLVGILRDGGALDNASAPALGDVTVLVEQIRAAGVPVTFTATGDVGAVPAGVSLAAYRIVQEALTNVVRHAGRAEATVTVRVTEEHVDLCIDDDGRGSTSALDPGVRDGGHGLIGMSERAEMYGGDVRSGPRPGGGFRVQATLRLSASPIANNASTDPTDDPAGTDGAAPTRRRIQPWMWDLALAALITGLATVETITSHPDSVAPHYAPINILAWLLRIVCCLTLAVRRRYPIVSLAAALVLISALGFGGYRIGLVVFVLWIGLYTVATTAPTRRLVAAVVTVDALIAILALSHSPDVTATGAVWSGILLIGVAVAGYVVRRDRERRTTDLAERENAADAHSRRARLVITNERLRIADELSTIVTRSIHTISQEAGEGSQMVDIDPIAARRTLEAISAISRDALNDLRRLLKRIRTESEPAIYTPITPTTDPVGVGEQR